MYCLNKETYLTHQTIQYNMHILRIYSWYIYTTYTVCICSYNGNHVMIFKAAAWSKFIHQASHDNRLSMFCYLLSMYSEARLGVMKSLGVMVVVLLLSSFSLLVATTASVQYTEEWLAWKKQYGKEYDSHSEEQNQQMIFETNLRRIEEHNSKPGQQWFTMAMNKFGDLVSKGMVHQAKQNHGYSRWQL